MISETLKKKNSFFGGHARIGSVGEKLVITHILNKVFFYLTKVQFFNLKIHWN